jgi:hypothetical protein
MLLDYFLKRDLTFFRADNFKKLNGKSSYIQVCFLTAVIVLIILDLQHPFNTRFHLSNFKLGQLFNETHNYLRDRVPDADNYSAADFSRLHTIAYGAYGGMLSAAYTGGRQGITLDCDDGRFLNTFSSYGGKYIITDNTSKKCSETFAQDSRVQALNYFADGSALFGLKRTADRPLGEFSEFSKTGILPAVEEGFVDLPETVLTNQIFYPIIAIKGSLFRKLSVDLITVGYRWKRCKSDVCAVVMEEQIAKYIWENPFFYYEDGGFTYIWITGPKIYHGLQSVGGLGITTPVEPGSYELEISLSNTTNNNPDGLLSKTYWRVFASPSLEFSRSYRGTLEVINSF